MSIRCVLVVAPELGEVTLILKSFPPTMILFTVPIQTGRP